MSTAGIALIAAIVAILASIAVATIVVRGRRESDRRLTEGLRQVGERMEGLARELADGVEKVREDALRTRIVESLAQALDLDEVLQRCAEGAAALHGVAGAIVSVELEGALLTAAAGLEPGAGTAGVVG